MHHTSSISSKLSIKEMFNTFCYQSTNMKENLIRFHYIVVQLNAARCSVSESDLVVRLLQSLPSEYDPLVQAIRLSVNELTLRRLIGAIQGEALRIESKMTKPKAVVLNAAKASKQGKSKIDYPHRPFWPYSSKCCRFSTWRSVGIALFPVGKALFPVDTVSRSHSFRLDLCCGASRAKWSNLWLLCRQNLDHLSGSAVKRFTGETDIESPPTISLRVALCRVFKS